MGGRNKRPTRPTRASTKPTKAASPSKKPLWRRPVAWIGGAATVVFTGVFTGVLVNVLSPQVQRITSPNGSASSSSVHLTTSPGASPSSTSPDPLSTPFSRAQSAGCPKSAGSVPFVHSVYHETSFDVQGQAVVLPQKVNLSENDLASLDKEGTGWLSERGAYDGGFAHIKLTLTGCQYVRILSMRPVILSRAKPLTGTLFHSAAQGEDADVSLYFNLDAANPVAKAEDVTGHLQPYFAHKTFSLKPNEQDTFAITADTNKWAVTWSLDIVYLYKGQIVNKIIDNDGQPFRVTAVYVSPGKYKASYYQCLGEAPNSQPGCSNISQMIWVKN